MVLKECIVNRVKSARYGINISLITLIECIVNRAKYAQVWDQAMEQI
jgi:hypothetical protein